MSLDKYGYCWILVFWINRWDSPIHVSHGLYHILKKERSRDKNTCGPFGKEVMIQMTWKTSLWGKLNFIRWDGYWKEKSWFLIISFYWFSFSNPHLIDKFDNCNHHPGLNKSLYIISKEDVDSVCVCSGNKITKMYKIRVYMEAMRREMKGIFSLSNKEASKKRDWVPASNQSNCSRT